MAGVLTGDAQSLLKKVESKSVHCVVTSPPYYGLRDYGHDGQIGLEETPDAYIERLCSVFDEVWRVLRDDGTLWLNIGDSYAGGGRGGQSDAKKSEGWQPNYAKSFTGIAPKNLLMIPARVAIALQARGWYLRSEIIWHKPNPMPESVTDRPTKSHEMVYLLTKQARYWYDVEAVKEPITDASILRLSQNISNQTGSHRQPFKTNGAMKAVGDVSGRNLRDVWTISTQPYSGAHFAVMPPELARKAIKAGCPAQVCSKCGKGYVAVVEKETVNTRSGTVSKTDFTAQHFIENGSGGNTNLRYRPITTTMIIDYSPTCDCNAPFKKGTVLDPFGGAGTTAVVAVEEGRDYLLCELNSDYAELAQERIKEISIKLQNSDPAQPIIYADGSKQLSLFAEGDL